MAGEIVLHEAFRGLLTLEKAAEAAGVHPELVARFVEFGLVEPVCREEGILLFRPEAVPRLRTIYRLRQEMGLNLPGIALVLELREEIVRLRGELAWLRRGD
ncbi:MAG: MerR family transcriptional regulator [Firmicutes bacterium]|nr:MerR family transcriptional regulator [Bacillota bacterium]